MNCGRCNYLLWDLPTPRCPECGLAFDVTDYSFPAGRVEFVCAACGHGHQGQEPHGHFSRRFFHCERCGEPADLASMRVRPLDESVQATPLRFATPWCGGGRRLSGFVDAVTRVAMNPADYFRLAALARSDGALVLSVICAYVAGAVVLTIALLLEKSGLLGGLAWLSPSMRPGILLGAVVAIPFLQIVWSYAYGLLIRTVLLGLGASSPGLDPCVRAVSLGSAVLPAVVLMPPIGLIWYFAVVCSGVEHLYAVNRSRAALAVGLPILFVANLGFAVWMLMA